MSTSFRHWGRGVVAGAALLLGAAGWQTSAVAGSDNSSNTYAGDYAALGLPAGTFLVIDYVGYRHGDAFIQNDNNFFGKIGQPHFIPSDVSLFTDITRLVYFTSLWNHPLILEAALPIVDVNKANIGTLGPQTVNDGVGDAVLFVTYGLVVEPKNERYIGFTNYFNIPLGNYDNLKGVNISTPNQFTWVPQIGIAEGLSKYGLRNFWVDIIANASIHSDGNSPLGLTPAQAAAFGLPAGSQFNTLTQDNSYDIKAFLRYDFAQAFWIAAGIEKSWGGNQTMTGGILGNLAFGPTSLGKDDFLKGHLQASYPLTRDFHVAVDLTHDFERSGGVREDFTAELRVTKFFIPAVEPLK